MNLLRNLILNISVSASTYLTVNDCRCNFLFVFINSANVTPWRALMESALMKPMNLCVSSSPWKWWASQLIHREGKFYLMFHKYGLIHSLLRIAKYLEILMVACHKKRCQTILWYHKAGWPEVQLSFVWSQRCLTYFCRKISKSHET